MTEIQPIPGIYLVPGFLVEILSYEAFITFGGKKRAKSVVIETGEKFASFTPANTLAPNWGKNIYDVLKASYQ